MKSALNGHKVSMNNIKQLYAADEMDIYNILKKQNTYSKYKAAIAFSRMRYVLKYNRPLIVIELSLIHI